jgi:FkbM family methyltransferase
MNPIAFVVTSTNQGTLILNKNDYKMVEDGKGFGVGFSLLNTGSYDQVEVDFLKVILNKRREHFGDGVIAVDCGANIGVHTVQWGRMMSTWGHVISIEAQEKIYYALCGNIAINNCFNVTARNYAVGSEAGSLMIPEPNYFKPSSYGSLELKAHPEKEDIGQEIVNTKQINMITIDSIGLHRCDLIKIDVERMEAEVLAGAWKVIDQFHPVLFIEVAKCESLEGDLVSHGYKTYALGANLLAVHSSDPMQVAITKDGVSV